MALRLPQFIKIPNHSRFEYKPIYYDKRKDDLKNKINKFKEEKELQEKGQHKFEIKSKFKSSYNREDIKKQKKASNLRLAIIIVFVTAIMFIIIQKSDLINKMFNVLFSG